MKTEFRKGDVCSLEVNVDGVDADGAAYVKYTHFCGDTHTTYVTAKNLTLLRRAPVDLASCELPVEVTHVRLGPAEMLDRSGNMAWIKRENGTKCAVLILDLRPLDAPAPAPDQSAQHDMAADIERLRAGGGKYNVPVGQTPLDEKLSHYILEVLKEGAKARQNVGVTSPYSGHSLEHCLHATGWVQQDLRMALTARNDEISRLKYPADLASTAPACADAYDDSDPIMASLRQLSEDQHATDSQRAVALRAMQAIAELRKPPTCPPGHILINGRAVPEPMREVADATDYVVLLDLAEGPQRIRWGKTPRTDRWLADGLIYPATQEGWDAARTHAEAIIAPSKREG